MVGQSDCPHDTAVVGVVFVDYLGGSCVSLVRSSCRHAPVGLVHHNLAYLLRCVSLGPSSAVVFPTDFSNIGRKPRYHKSLSSVFRLACRDVMLCCLTVQSRDEA